MGTELLRAQDVEDINGTDTKDVDMGRLAKPTNKSKNGRSIKACTKGGRHPEGAYHVPTGSYGPCTQATSACDHT